MKKILLLLIVLWCFYGTVANAQTYQPFPKFNAAWEEAYWNFAGQVAPSYTVLCGDTLIDNEEHSKVYNLFLDSLGQIIEWHYAGALMEDDNKMVWITSPSGHTGLLYDFNLDVGQAFSEIPNMIVESTGTAFVNGVAHRSITFESVSGLPKEIWIEGVGSSFGMLTRGTYAIDYSPFMKCFSIDGIIHYDFNTGFDCTFSFQDDACDVINGVKQVEHSVIQVQVSPNPFSDKLNVKFEKGHSIENGGVYLYNSIGENLIEVPFTGFEENLEIDLPILSSGTYFVVIKNEYGEILGTQKVIRLLSHF